METDRWTVTYRVRRQNAQGPTRFEQFTLEVDPDEYVLDGVERIWAFHDRTLTFRHACHHSTCGACGMRVNGTEKLTCITRIRDVTRDGGVVTVEPLRNFPVVSDLVVDMTRLYAAMERVGAETVVPAGDTLAPAAEAGGELLRLADCIECGLCISACPVMATTLRSHGPAPLSAAQQRGLADNPELLESVDCADGLWRCHSSFECSAVCPSGVDPAQQIMGLRRQVVRRRLKQLFRSGKEHDR
jgi:succinate dehydrogenase / fumarate reductase iron-sulfur subunit